MYYFFDILKLEESDMSFEEMLKKYKAKTCILSIEKIDETNYGNIRVVAGNQAHCEDILHITGHPFVPGCPYEMCFPKNMNFEDFCYRAAIGGEPMHTYVNLYQMGLWLNMFMIPLESEEENKGYCIYTYDVTPQANTEHMSDLSVEASSKVLQTCIKLRGSTDFEKTMDEIIGDIRDICGADKCCVLIMDYDNKKCQVGAESSRSEEFIPLASRLDESFYEMALQWEHTLQGSTCIIIKDEKDMQAISEVDPAWCESLKVANVQSLVLMPLKRGETILGYIWAENFNTDDTVKIKEILELTAFFVASELSNYQLMERLRVMSSIDMLTGINNRNLMNNRIDRIVAGKDKIEEPYAIIFADLNGLKRVNDTMGHQAGDDMIRDAALLLAEVFYDGEVYRAGGDEYMVLACKMDKETVEKRVKELVEKANATKNVRFAVGVSASADEPDILKAMRLADKHMYEDKHQYYTEHPDLVYRQ